MYFYDSYNGDTKVYSIFTDEKEIPKWRPYVTHCEVVDRSPSGDVLTRKITYDFTGRKKYALETVLVANCPSDYKSRFESNGGTVWQYSSFRPVSSSATLLWVYEAEFEQVWFLKLITFFFRNFYKKTAQTEVMVFKQYVENPG